MQELDFAIDGTWASTKGITLCRSAAVSAAVPKTQSINIPGRNGALHIDEGAYNARTCTIDCFALDSTDVAAKMDEIMSFLFLYDGYHKLKLSDDTGHYWKARIVNGGQIATRLAMLNPFSIEFECLPFRYVNDAEDFINIPYQLVNPTSWTAKPIFFVYSGTNGTISNSTGTITVTGAEGQFYIDCEDMRAYRYSGESADSWISCDNFPYLPTLGTIITVTGDLVVKIAPRWHTL